ncbi:SLIRP isoform 6, partial [Pongo abelii]
VRRIPWTVASSQLKEHFAQFGHVRRTRRLAFTEVWLGFSFLQKKDFRMPYNGKIIL